MKKLLCLLLLSALLTGCADVEYEFVSDSGTFPALPSSRQMVVSLPPTIAKPTFSGDDGSCMYVCPDYVISQQVLSGGDMVRTLQTVTGYSPEDLTILETKQENCSRFDCVFTVAGESEQELCRLTVLDDGYYHYILCIQAGESVYPAVKEEIEQILSSFYLGPTT